MNRLRAPTATILTLSLLSWLLAAPALADEEPKPDRSGDKLCFRAQGCPNCDWAILIALGMAQSPEVCGEGPYVSGELGLLRNVSERVGVGGTFFYGGDDCAARYGVRSHVRLWLHPQASLDFGPGIILGAEEGEYSPYQWPSFTGQVSLDLAGLVAPFYQVDLLRGQDGTRWDSFAGLKVESYAAPIVALALAIAFAATYSYY